MMSGRRITDRPDIVLLILDTQRVDRLSCYGYPSEISPHLDELAAEGTRFTRAVAPAQWTVPSHASMFTGLYPSQHTVYQMESVLPAELPTVAERLQQAGYFTAGFSHNPLIGVVKNGLQRGFHSFQNYNHLGAGLLAFHLRRAERQVSGPARIRQFARFMLAELLGYSQQTPAHWFSSLALPLWKTALKLGRKTKAMKTKQSLAAVSQLLIERGGVERHQPIFAFINLMGTHVPYEPPRWAVERFLPGVLGRRATNVLLQRANNWQVDVRNWLDLELPEAEYKGILNALYNAEVAAQDAQIGWFVERLRQSGAWDNTFLIVTADHGDHLGEKQRLNHAFGVYEPLARVPLLIRDPWATLPPGASLESFVSTRRLFHTVLTTAGTATQDEEVLSLARAGDAGDDGEQGIVFSEGHPLNWAVARLEKYRPGLAATRGYNQPVRAIYSGAYKLISTNRQCELYDVHADPAEAMDLSQRLPEKAVALNTQLADFVKRARPAGAKTTQQEEDAAVLEHLRQLGYLE